MTFVRNAWYVVAWSRDLADRPLGVRVLDEDIVVYRTAAGSVAALEDQCPHRRLPLSMGRIRGDAIECGYHGMTFGPDGRCVRIPGQSNLPDSAFVRSYPVCEEHGVVWVWTGDPAAVTPVHDLSAYLGPDRALEYGDALHIRANYLHLAENLCDPAHVAFVHPTTLGNPESEGVPVDVVRHDRTVITSRWIRNSPPIGFFKAFGGFAGMVDRWHYYHFHAPNIAVIDFGSIETSRHATEDDRHEGVRLYAMHFLTPVSGTETVDHWAHSRNIGLDDPGIGERMNTQLRVAFDEDKAILEAIQRREDRGDGRRPVRLAIDRGPNMLRGIISQLAREEQPGG